LNVIITGASRGIGRELAKYYSKKAKVFAIARDEDKLKELNVEAVKCDLSNIDEVRKLKFKDIDMVICNAGISIPHSATFPKYEDFETLFKVNFLSIHALLENIIPQMQKQKRGKIVLISSLASVVASPTSIAYSASKRAINSYAQSLRNMLYKDNIQVINILPGFIKTDMTDKNDFHMPFLMELDEGVSEIIYAIENNKKEYAFPKRFFYILKVFNMLPIAIQDKILKNLAK